MSKPYITKGSTTLVLALSASTVLNLNPAFAEEGEEPLTPAVQTAEIIQDKQLETFVVVGETTNTVVTPEQLEKYQANDLADIFRHVPSVSVGGSVGIAQKIYVRGLEDTYLNVTVDGAPQTGTLFHHIGRLSIEPELLKEVEVQAGAGEASSGAGAIGGAIRFKTKNAGDLLGYGEQFGAIGKASYFSNNGEKLSITGYGKFNDDWGFLGSFVNVDRDDMEDGYGNKINHSSTQQQLAFLKLNGQLTESQTVTLSYEQRKEEAAVAQRPNWIAGPNDPVFPADGERNTFVLNHTLDTNGLISLESTFYYTESEFIQDTAQHPSGGWGDYLGATESYGFDIRNTTTLGQHSFILGGDYRFDTSESRYLNPAKAGFPSPDQFKEEGKVSGLYLQDHWQVTDALLLSFGVRYDHYELTEKTKGDSSVYNTDIDSNGLSPNIGFSYNFTDEWKLTTGYAEAMRGKEVSDAFTLEHSSSAFQDKLEPEKVKNTEIGLEYDDGSLIASASIYRSKIDDVTADQIGAGTFFENIGELETQGYELMLGYHWDKLSIIASFVSNDVELNGHDVEGYENIGLVNSQGDTWNVDLNYQLNNQWEMGWHFTRVNDLNNIETLHRAVDLGWISALQSIDKDGYDVHDIYVRWEATKELTLDLSVNNLLDEGYRDHSTVGDYSHISGWESVVGNNEAGRDVRLTASYVF